MCCDDLRDDSSEVSSRESQQLATNNPALGGRDDPINDLGRQAATWLVQPEQQRLQQLNSTCLHAIDRHFSHGEAPARASCGLCPSLILPCLLLDEGQQIPHLLRRLMLDIALEAGEGGLRTDFLARAGD